MRARSFSTMIVAILAMVFGGDAFADSMWNSQTGGNWGTAGNWSGGVPNGINATATLRDIISSNATVTVNSNVTLGTLNISASNSYTLAGSGNARLLTFDASKTGVGTAYINVSGAGSPTITSTNLSLVLNDTTVINQSGSGVFAINANIGGAGGLTYNGTGSGYTILGGTNTFNGALTIKSGTVLLNSGALNGAVSNSLVIGTGAGASRSAIARNLQEGQLGNTATLTVNSDGWFDINAGAYGDRGGSASLREETVGQVNLAGGLITTGVAGSLKIDPTTAATAGFASAASTQTALIDATGGNVDINGSRTFDVAAGTQARDLEVRGAIVSSVAGAGLTKTGSGRLALTGTEANTFSGATVVSGGTLELAKSNGVSSIAGSSITVNSGGTLLLSSSEQIQSSTALTLAGGKLAINNVSGTETLGVLTLSGTSSIDMGTAAYLLQFADSSSLCNTWTGHLTIYGWSGAPNASGTAGQIFFGSNSSGLTSAQLSMISFNGFGSGAILLTSGELVPCVIPEAGTHLAGGLVVLLLLLAEVWRQNKATPSKAGRC